jgi:hypothetical protein
VSPSTVSLSTFGVESPCLNDLSMIVGFNCSIQVVLKDVFGNSAFSGTSSSASVRKYLTEDKTSLSALSSLPGSSMHRMYWMAAASGSYKISLLNSADQSLVRVFDVSVCPAAVCASTSIVTGPGVLGAVMGQTMSLTVVIRDQYGNIWPVVPAHQTYQ